ncbi:uncharacterized protein LOC113316669 [Papaver somniferum]|uniref:uncharacterized protein LOC113316669 n=1 Tax=Papaver somniferum TaxID=3469 RepID=UPI000E6FD571|nr:uncharacterized protein LOC113316669 [Papaver somniferum]
MEYRVSSITSLYSTSSSLSSSSSESSSIVSFLIKSCGLSQNEALFVSNQIKSQTTSQPDSVVELFENYGFTKPYISKIITKQPSFLLYDPFKTLKPKLDFFNSKGLHGIELADFISKNPTALMVSLKSQLILSFDILKNILHTDTDVITALKASYRVLNVNVLEKMMANLEVLRYEGVPPFTIAKFLIKEPRVFMGNAEKFKNIVE